MRVRCLVALSAAALLLLSSVAWADGIEPGLWKITTRIETNGVLGPPHETQKCLTAEQTRDVAVANENQFEYQACAVVARGTLASNDATRSRPAWR